MASNTPHSPTSINPLELSIEQTAQMFSAIGGKKINHAHIQADLDAGAPVATGRDGQVRINLVHYTAWLLREMQSQ